MKYLTLAIVCMLLGACTPHKIETASSGRKYWSDTVYINGHKIVNIHSGSVKEEIMGSFEASDCPKCYNLFD